MNRILGLGLIAAVSVWGCTKSGDDDDTGNNTGSGGAAPIGSGGAPVATGSGGAKATGSGGASNMVGTGSGGKPGTAGTGTAGMGGAGGMSGSGGMGGTGGMSMTTDGGMPVAGKKPPCIAKGSNLILLGDSYVNYVPIGQNLEPRLTEHAITDGALMQGDAYEDHAVPGTSLAASIPLIEPQWDDAATGAKVTNKDIRYVVMDGGGNDVLLWNNQCLADGSGADMSCQQVALDGMAVSKKMLEDMKATGVSAVLYFFYPNVPAGGAEISAWTYPMAKKQCEDMDTDTFKCHFVSLIDTFAGHADYIGGDNIHPTEAGMDAQGAFIWEQMKMFCIGQSEASGDGCCEPTPAR